MKSYAKPVFRLAAAIENPHPGISCTTSQEDMELLSILTGFTLEQLKNAFAISEGCEGGLEIDHMCKFSSVTLGAQAAFLS